jgi:hypothetical protein
VELAVRVGRTQAPVGALAQGALAQGALAQGALAQEGLGAVLIPSRKVPPWPFRVRRDSAG